MFVLSVPALIGEAFEEGGGAVGQLFNQIGAAAEGYAAAILEEAEIELPQIEALPQQPVGQKVIDFIVRNTETAKQLFIEVKYGIPSSPDAMPLMRRDQIIPADRQRRMPISLRHYDVRTRV